jgi:hypothetical protein
MIVDIHMDEQASLNVFVNTVMPDGVTPRDITGGSVTWKASFNGISQIKKDTSTMLVMLDTAPSSLVTVTANAGQPSIKVAQVSGFAPRPNDGWRTLDFAPGDIVNITSASGSEVNQIATINPGTFTITMVTPLQNQYTTANGAAVTKIISMFMFSLLPGDTILPATKSYGTPILWDHMAQVTFPSPMLPSNIYQEPATLVAVRGRIFINPILDMS